MGDMFKQFLASVREHDPGPLVRQVLRGLAAMALFLLALILYAPALGDSRFIFGTDTVSHDYIMHFYAWEKSIGEAGEVPLWNPYLFSGFPMIASAAICPFYPSQWLYLVLPFNTGFTLQYVLAVLVGGIGAAWWMRTVGHRRSIAFWAGILYMVSGHFLTLTHAGHLQKMIALGWTPVALGATIQLVRLGKTGVRHSSRYKAAALLGLALAMQMLASHPQIFYATAAACVLQLVGMALAAVPWRRLLPSARPADAVKPAKGLRPVGRAIAMSLLALVVCSVISAVQLFPTWEMSSLSNRADGVSFTEAVETSYPPLELLEYAIPSVFGDSVRESAVPYFGKWGERIVSDYIGLPVLFLALTGLFGSKRRYRYFLLILLLVGVLVGLGRYTPVYWLLYHAMPGFDNFRSPGTFMFLANCALVGLAAFGLDYLVSLAGTVNDEGWGSSFSESGETETAKPSAFAKYRGETPAYGNHTPDADETQPFRTDAITTSDNDTPPQNPSIDYDYSYEPDDPGYGYSYEPPQGQASSNFTWDTENRPWLGRPAMLIFIAAVAVAALAGAIIALAENWDVDLKIATDAELLGYHKYSSVAGAAVAIMATLFAILLLRLRTWIGGVAIALIAVAFPIYHNYHYLKFEPLMPYMAHLTRQPDLLSLSKSGAPQPIRLLEENQLKNEQMLYKVGSATGYHPIVAANYANAMDTLVAGSDEFGALFFINHARTFGDQPPAAGNWLPGSEHSTSGRQSTIWKRAYPTPYSRDEAELVKVDTDDLSLTSATLRDIAMTSLAAPAPEGQNPPAQPYVARVSEYDVRRHNLYEGNQMAEALLQRWSPHEIRLRTRAAVREQGQRALLPLSEPYFPGWMAETSEGVQLPVVPVNGLQRGVVLPAGEHNIRLRYSPYALRLGLFISLVSATVLISFGMGTISRRIIKSQKKVKKVIKRTQAGHPISADGDGPAPNFSS